MSFIFAVMSFVAGMLIRYVLEGRHLSKPRSAISVERLAYYLNAFVIWVAMPAMILRSIPGLALDSSALLPVAVAWGSFFAALLIVILLSPLLSFSKDERLVLIILIGLGNTAFLGTPLIEALLGQAALPLAILYDQLGSFLLLSICVITLIALHQQQAQTPSIGSTVKRVMSFPPFVSLLVALFLPLENHLIHIQAILDAFALTILPIALLVVGLHFRMTVLAEDLTLITVVAIVKLLLLPLVVFKCLSVFYAPDFYAPIVLQNAMPPMITPALLLIGAGVMPRFVSTSLGYLTLLGCLSVWGWHLLLAV